MQNCDVPLTERPTGPAEPGNPRPSGERYPTLLRTAESRWWHPFAGIAVLAATWLALGAVLVQGLSNGSSEAPADSAFDLAVAGLALAVALPGAVLAAVYVHRVRPGFLLSVTGRLRARPAAVAAIVAMPAFVPMLVNRGAFDTGPDSAGNAVEWVGWPTFLSFLVVIVLVLPLQSVAEEVVFRGYLTQAFAVWTRRPWLAAAASSFLFALGHGAQNGWLFADRLFFALALCWLTWRTGGLEAAIAVHLTYNVLVVTASAATGRVGSTVEASHSEALGALSSMAGTALVVLVVALWAQRRRLAVRATPAG